MFKYLFKYKRDLVVVKGLIHVRSNIISSYMYYTIKL